MIKKGYGYYDIYNYRNSRYFIATVKEARRYEKDTNSDLVIFAGACQSYFEAIIASRSKFSFFFDKTILLLSFVIVVQNFEV